MAGRQGGGVFLSYARKDGEAFAGRLRKLLGEKAPDIDIKQDRILLEGGVGWWKQITEAIDSVEFLVLVMTPSAMESENVRKEWRYARQQGVCVYPVKGALDSELRFSELPRWMNKAHFYDIGKEWESFVAHLRKGCDSPRVPFMAPDMPETFVQRPGEFERLKNYLLSADKREPVAITTALAGAGGFGKTTLATALCHDEDVVQNFDDGILWVTLGQQPNVMGSVLTLYSALTGERPGFASEEDAAFQLSQKLEDRTCLVVVDDVWDAAHLRPFLRGGKKCARLITTRDTEIAAEAKRVEVDEMTSAESVALLTTGLPGLGAENVRELSRRLGEWPLALELARAAIRLRMDRGDTPERAVQGISTVLDRQGVRALSKSTADPRHRTVDSVLEVSLALLSGKERARLCELSIFPEDTAIPLTAAGTLWDVVDWEAEVVSQALAKLSLLKLDLQHGTIRLHDVMRSWLGEQVKNAADLHGRLVDAWGDRHKLTDAYAWRWLGWHLAQAGRETDLRKTLWDAEWLQAKLDATDVNALVQDFEYLKPDSSAELVQGALRLSAHVLARDKRQLLSQLLGRLREAETLVAEYSNKFPWLRPLTQSLTPPGSALVRTLIGHSDSVTAVAVYAEGKRAISASGDHTLKIWDLESGMELRTLGGHEDWVNGVAVSADGKQAISASSDHTLKMWDLDRGTELRTLRGHTSRVGAVTMYGEDKRAISASDDHTLKVWDIESGTELRTLSGHGDRVNAVAVYAAGKRAISASGDRTLKVWELENGTELRPLTGHRGRVGAVVVDAAGKRAISASGDGTLKVWDVERGAELRTLTERDNWVTAVTMYAEGKRAISASLGLTLKIWDVERGTTLRTVTGHGTTVNAIAVYADGTRAVSASYDHTLKVWDLESGRELYTPGVRAVAVDAEGDRAISAYSDDTLKVWDVKSGTELHSFTGQLSSMYKAAIYAEGKRAILAPHGNSLTIADVESGAELRTFALHWDASGVDAIGVDAKGKLAMVAFSTCTIRIVDLESETELRTLRGHTLSVNAVAMNAEGRRAISASSDGTIKIWDIESGTEFRTLSGYGWRVRTVALDPEGKRAIFACDDGTIGILDVETGNTLASFAADGPVTACAIGADGIIVAGDKFGQMHFLRLEERAERPKDE